MDIVISVLGVGAVVALFLWRPSQEVERARACYFVMNLIGWFVIVPLGLGALASGLVQSLGTEWGVFRHYWILAKLVLTVIGVPILIAHMRSVTGVAGMTSETLSLASSSEVKKHLVVHAVGGLVILMIATTLSVFKPWGKTGYGRRKAVTA